MVLTDVAQSTTLWAQHPNAMLDVITRHHEIVHAAIEAHGGWCPVDQGEGDAVFAAFDSVSAAVDAVLQFQRLLRMERWPDGIEILDRVGIHAGEVAVRDRNLFGVEVSRAARIRSLGAGGQVLMSSAARALLPDLPGPEVSLTDLGEHRLKDLSYSEAIFQVVGRGMLALFPPLVGFERFRHNLPMQASAFVGRAREIAELGALLRHQRLVTIVGFGGLGKTRLALHAAAERADAENDGVWFVDLSGLSDPGDIPAAVAAALGIDEGVDGAQSAVVRWLRPRSTLLVLDNLEQLLPGGAEVIALLLAAGPGVHLLVTSREVLRVRGEHVFVLEPLALPEPRPGGRWTAHEIAELHASAAVELFMLRATAVRRDFALTSDTAGPVAEICSRLDGMPLALELVAAQLRAFSPQLLLTHLSTALNAGAGGGRDLPARQRTLRATVEWSTTSVAPERRRLLWRLAVFRGSFTLDAAAAICGIPMAQEPDADVYEGILELVDRSLVRVLPAADTEADDRYGLLAPIREFANAQLTALDPLGVARARHAHYFAGKVAFDRDCSRADRSAIWDFVSAEWLEVRAALDLLHDRGQTAEELAASIWLSRGLQADAREGLAITVLRHALQHVDDDDAGEVSIALRVHLAEIEYGADRVTSARAGIVHARDLLRRNREPSLVVFVAGVNTIMQDPCGDGPESFAEALSLLEDLPSTGNAVPRWYITEVCVLAAIASGIPASGRIEQLREQMLVESSGREHLRLRVAQGLFLLFHERFDDALKLLQPFIDARTRRSSWRAGRVLALIALGDIHIVAGRLNSAAVVLGTAAGVLADFDLPFESAFIPVLLAAVERGFGRLDDAAARLTGTIPIIDERSVQLAAGYAHWLLSVIEHERGRPEAALHQLRWAWRLARTDAEEHLAVLCLSQRWLLTRKSHPLQALRCAAMVLTHPVRVPYQFGVAYPIGSHLLREPDGGAAEAVLQWAKSESLELPAWDAW